MPMVARPLERQERDRGRNLGIRIEFSQPIMYEVQASMVKIPGPAFFVFSEGSFATIWDVGIIAPEGFRWQLLPGESTMEMDWLHAIRKALVRELKAVPEVVGLYSAYDSGLLNLWVLVSGQSPDLEYRVAEASYRAWEREGLRRHELIITSYLESIPSDACRDYVSTTG